MRFTDPRTDFAFKKIFGNDNAKEVLISFLNAVLALDKDHAIVDVTLLNPYEAPKTKYMRDSFLDVKCRDVRGVTFIVEMQVAYVAGFEKRIIYNASKAYSNQLQKGDAYPKLNQVISINILDFVLFDDFEHYLSCHQVREKITGNNYLDEIRYYFIELPKFTKTEEELETYIEKWIYFIKHAADLETIPEKLDEPVFHKAFDQANRANMTAKELEAYDNSVTVMLDERGRIQGAFEMGEKSGLQRAARAMKQKNMQVDLIAELTGLSINEVLSLN
ncbi:MAG: Rpn family recombination-promoting nuclease/putative transposase [candidate division KSB1 bacterium]|nr:Rpn family recombination-promoting nuclease/putative transposase [candidate division KSB1 bacterium]